MKSRRLYGTHERGIILVTVLIITMVLSIVAIGVMSLNVSQVKTGSSVIDAIKAEQLAAGIFYQQYQQRVDQAGTLPTNIILGDTTYLINRVETSGTGPNATNSVALTITY